MTDSPGIFVGGVNDDWWPWASWRKSPDRLIPPPIYIVFSLRTTAKETRRTWRPTRRNVKRYCQAYATGVKRSWSIGEIGPRKREYVEYVASVDVKSSARFARELAGEAMRCHRRVIGNARSTLSINDARFPLLGEARRKSDPRLSSRAGDSIRAPPVNSCPSPRRRQPVDLFTW